MKNFIISINSKLEQICYLLLNTFFSASITYNERLTLFYKIPNSLGQENHVFILQKHIIVLILSLP